MAIRSLPLVLVALTACERADRLPEPPPTPAVADPAGVDLSLLEEFTPIELAMTPPQQAEALAGLKVEVTEEGEGAQISYGMPGRFQVIISDAAGKILRNTFEREPVVLRLLPPHVPVGVAVAAAGMKVGERRNISVPAEHAYGADGDPMQRIPAHARLFYDIELLDVVDDLEIGILRPGTGESLQYGQWGKFLYTGVLAADGTVFDSNAGGEPISLGVREGAVIAGWYLGLPSMQVGEKRRLRIPAALAYGEAGSPPKIGANADLIFDVELVEIN